MPSFKIGPKGVYLHVEGPMINGWEEYKGAYDLVGFADELMEKEAPELGLHWVGTKIPMSVIAPVIGTIRKFPNMETGYMLYYSVPKREWMIKCPKQLGSAGSVRFNDDGADMPPTFFPVGTIHTHPNMSAFWSSTDMADQKGRYEVHMVFGLRNGVIETSLITIFSPRGQYDQKFEDLFDQDVNLKAECQENKEWVDTINLAKAPDFKIVQNGQEFGHPTVIRPMKEPQRIYRHFDLDEYVLAKSFGGGPVEPPKKPSDVKLRPFAQFLVNTYGYDAEELADWCSENASDEEDIDLIYGKSPDEDPLQLVSTEVTELFADSWSIYDHPELLKLSYSLKHFIAVLKSVIPVNFIRKMHSSEKIEKDDWTLLNILYRYIPKIQVRMMLADFAEQVDETFYKVGDIPLGGRFFSNEMQLWAEMACNSVWGQESVKYSITDLTKALRLNSGGYDQTGRTDMLTWQAMAVLLAYVFEFPEDIVFYWELIRRMEKEGRTWC